jgi:hypothetical protein
MFPVRRIDYNDLLAVGLKPGNDNVNSFLFDYEVKVLIPDQRDLVGVGLASREFSFDGRARFDLADLSSGCLKTSFNERRRMRLLRMVAKSEAGCGVRR